MRRIIWAIALLVAAASVHADTDREAAVRAAVDAFGEAFVAADTERLDAMLVGDYVHVNGGSGNLVDRASWLSWVASRKGELESGRLVVDTYAVEDVAVVIHGHTAIVTGIVRSTTTRDGESRTSNLRFTNVWLEQDGVWRRAAFHDSALPARD